MRYDLHRISESRSLLLWKFIAQNISHVWIYCENIPELRNYSSFSPLTTGMKRLL